MSKKTDFNVLQVELEMFFVYNHRCIKLEQQVLPDMEILKQKFLIICWTSDVRDQLHKSL